MSLRAVVARAPRACRSAVADLADGLRTAVTVGGVASALGGLLAFTLRGPQRAAAPHVTGAPVGTDSRLPG
ncbi:hypothetical protein [Streptomyces sp. NPDC005955]|uniref:hypothetical protein n=1 Tax=Streptomyces sp. NPDC005955 TaxID=3364738 RepID=UPI003696A4AE